MSKKKLREKIVRQAADAHPQKKPKWNDPEIDGHPLAWRFSGCDRGGPFSWVALAPPEKYKEIVDKLREFETKTLTQLHEGGSHPIQVHKLEKVARDRLAAIGQDDVDDLMSFRLGGAHRVWCIQQGHIMRILWWDPSHQVYIVPKDRGDRAKRHRRHS